jgi:transposase
MQITTIGLDIAKNVFQVHGIDSAGRRQEQLRRGQVLKFFEALPPCLIDMEACANAHNWARELTRLGQEVGLVQAKDVKALSSATKTMRPTLRQSARQFAGRRCDLCGRNRPSSRADGRAQAVAHDHCGRKGCPSAH